MQRMLSFKQFVDWISPPPLDDIFVTEDGESARLLREGKWIVGRFKNSIRVDRDTHHRTGDQHFHVYGRKGQLVGVLKTDGSVSHGDRPGRHSAAMGRDRLEARRAGAAIVCSGRGADRRSGFVSQSSRRSPGSPVRRSIAARMISTRNRCRRDKSAAPVAGVEHFPRTIRGSLPHSSAWWSLRRWAIPCGR